MAAVAIRVVERVAFEDFLRDFGGASFDIDGKIQLARGAVLEFVSVGFAGFGLLLGGIGLLRPEPYRYRHDQNKDSHYYLSWAADDFTPARISAASISVACFSMTPSSLAFNAWSPMRTPIDIGNEN